MFIEIPASKRSITLRKPVYSMGINDACYVVKPTINGKRLYCPFYVKWIDMIRRCHAEERLLKFPTYRECSVCDEWLTFSNFKRWMIKQEWQGMHLDKDIINPNNKVYSPENCCFVSGSLNALLTDSGASRGENPKGVSWHKPTEKYEAYVCLNGRLKYLGLHMTSRAAYAEHVKAKTRIILDAADNQTDPRITSGLRLHAQLLIDSK